MTGASEPRDSPLAIRNAWIVRTEGPHVAPVFGHLHLKDARVEVIERRDWRRPYGSAARRGRDGHGEAAVLQASGRLVTAPLVNFHEHIYSRLARGVLPVGPTDSFLNTLRNLWWALDRRLDAPMVEACAGVAALEAVRAGVTTIFDHHSSQRFIGGSLRKVAAVLGAAGLRGALCFETSDRDGEEAAAAGLRENRDFALALREEEPPSAGGQAGSGPAGPLGRAQGAGLRSQLGLHAPFTLGEETLRRAALQRAELGTSIHIHLCEDRVEGQHSREHFRQAPATRLARHGLLDPAAILAHGVHCDAEDFRAISDSGAALALCPESNLNNAVGLPQYASIPGGIPLLAGTDGMHGSPLRSVKQLFLQLRHQGGSSSEAMGLVRKVWADQLGFLRQYFPDHSGLQPGDRADVVVWDYRPPGALDAESFWAHLVYGLAEAPVHSLAQGGELLVREGRLQGRLRALEERLGEELARQGARLQERMAARREG